MLYLRCVDDSWYPVSGEWLTGAVVFAVVVCACGAFCTRTRLSPFYIEQEACLEVDSIDAAAGADEGLSEFGPVCINYQTDPEDRPAFSPANAASAAAPGAAAAASSPAAADAKQQHHRRKRRRRARPPHSARVLQRAVTMAVPPTASASASGMRSGASPATRALMRPASNDDSELNAFDASPLTAPTASGAAATPDSEVGVSPSVLGVAVSDRDLHHILAPLQLPPRSG